MISLFDKLQTMPYPGRTIIVGSGPDGQRGVLYAITGRSPSSQARRLVIDEKEQKIFVRPTDEDTLKTGNPDLLVYAAIMCGNGRIAVSNGKQTGDVFKTLQAEPRAERVLQTGLVDWEFEPDDAHNRSVPNH